MINIVVGIGGVESRTRSYLMSQEIAMGLGSVGVGGLLRGCRDFFLDFDGDLPSRIAVEVRPAFSCTFQLRRRGQHNDIRIADRQLALSIFIHSIKWSVIDTSLPLT